MLDINFIRENPQKVKKACDDKQVEVDVDKILSLDKKRRELITESERLRAEQHKLKKPSNEAEMAVAKKLKEKFKNFEIELKKTEEELEPLLLALPNVAFDDVPVGKDESQNVVVRQVGKKLVKSDLTNFKDYMEIGTALDLIDTERAGKVAGSRFGYIKGQLALLEFALIKLALDTAVKKGFIPVIPPVMVKEKIAGGTGFLEGTDKQECYFLPEDQLYLTGTSEQSLVGMHADEILDANKLPLKYVGFSTCFRREAGSYGKDTKGILRVHQFDKLEMVVFSKHEDSKKEHELLLSIEEELMKKLALPYQVVNICTGDLGRPAAKKYDIECWLPSENKYRETHSTSNCTDFQARRLNTRYKDKNNKMQFVHTLNATAFAIGRILIMILENYQQKDGSVKVPKVLQKHCGFRAIK
jgi:seryl-tRNA synthetase